jgi:hypothetical protein
MTTDKLQEKWPFGRSWIIANTLSWGVSPLVAMLAGWAAWQLYQQLGMSWSMRALSDNSNRLLIAEVIYAVCWGIIVGASQQFVLRRRFDLGGQRWISATAIGLLFYRLLSDLPLVLAPFIGSSISALYQNPLLIDLAKLISLFALGIAQWFILRRILKRAGWWIIATALALWLSAIAFSVFMSGQLWAFHFIVAALAEGIIYSIATFVVLTTILKQKIRVATE